MGEMEELLSYIPANDGEVVTKLLNDLESSKSTIVDDYNRLAEKTDSSLGNEIEDLLAYIPASDSEVVAKLLETLKTIEDKQNELVAKYNNLSKRADFDSEIEELLAYIPANDPEIIAKLLESLNVDTSISSRYNDLVAVEEPAITR